MSMYSDLNLIGQGTFSCIFRPAISCDNTIDPKNSNYFISKVTKNDKNTKNEVEISNIVKTIPHFFHHFSPIEESCGANIKKLLDEPGRRELYTDCELFKSGDATAAPAAKEYVYNKSRYVGKKDLYDFLSHEGEHEYKETYEYLKYSIKLLQEKKIVHYDLKENNIMIHENSSLPIIIDFGISLNIEKLLAGGAGTSTLEELKHAFYAYSPTYEVWCFEINFICFLFNARGSRGDDAAFVNTPISSPITNEDLKAVVIDYQKNPVFDITNIDREKYSAELIAFYGKYLGKPANEAIIDIITKYWRTWDVYSLAICFLNAINGAEFENKSVFQKELLKSVLVNPELRV